MHAETSIAESHKQYSNLALWFLGLLSFTHGVIDLNSGAVLALLPTLRESFSLSYTAVGTVLLCSSLTSSLTQPIFGYISDHSEQRWLLPVSLLLAGGGLALLGWMPSYWLVLVAVVISALGTATFHPEGAHAAHHLGGKRRALSMAIYSAGGSIGYSMGTLYIALLLTLGPALKGATWAIVLPALLAAILFRLLPRWKQIEVKRSAAHFTDRRTLPTTNWQGISLLTLLVILRQVIATGTAAYIPFFWMDILHHDPQSARYVQLMYLVTGVFGTLLGAPLADRFGPKKVLVVSFALLAPLQIALPFLSDRAMLLCLGASGFLVLATFTLTLVMTQAYMPRSLGLASGINLGLAFGMGGVGTLLLGMISDHWSILAAIYTMGATTIPCLVLTLLLPPLPKEETVATPA